MRLVLLGTGSPQPDPERAGPSQLVIVDDVAYLVDCGDGCTRNLLHAGIRPADVKRVLFTHLHSDHTLGYAQFLLAGWASGRRQLTVIGPPGARHLHDTLVHDLYRRDIAFRMSLGRPGNGLTDVVPLEVEGGEAYSDERVRVTAVPVAHDDGLTMAFRFDADQKSIVLSGDTVYTPTLVRLARGADILVHDANTTPNAVYSAQTPEKRSFWNNLQKYHATPADAGRAAREAGVKTLVLTHLLPGTDAGLARAAAAAEFRGVIHVGVDLMMLEC